MPEVVDAFIRDGDYKEVRTIQNSILESYDKDFSKHPPLNTVPRIKMVWNAIPSQLAKENRKFIFGAVKSGARAKEFELAIMWLQDVGLLGAKSGLDAKTLIDGNEIFGQYKGALTEQYVLQQFKSIDDIAAYYWTPDEGIAEIDFLIQISGYVIPVEVKAAENLKAKSYTGEISDN